MPGPQNFSQRMGIVPAKGLQIRGMDGQLQNALWYDFLEHVGEIQFTDESTNYFVEEVNEALEKENAGYRFVHRKFIPITSDAEVAEVLKVATPTSTVLAPVSKHIQQATDLLSDRQTPDYRNSMKESISAVESLCKFISGLQDKTLGPALKKTTEILGLNEDLRDGFHKIYGYTSDDHGIRHSLKDMDHPEQEDARFLLVACSAFVNYVTEKARKQNKLPG